MMENETVHHVFEESPEHNSEDVVTEGAIPFSMEHATLYTSIAMMMGI